eukprot:Skav205794  [mRNA]  locus=scaffold340:457962:459722:- [translate_table: standard]
MEVVRDHCECEAGPCPQEFETGIILDVTQCLTRQGAQLSKLVERVFRVKTWRNANHHESHALMAYYSSPFRSALIISFDGGGNDGFWNVFVGHGLDVYRIAREPASPVLAYTQIGSYLPAITGSEESLQTLCDLLSNSSEYDLERVMFKTKWPLEKRLTFAGKLMGYSGIRAPSAEASDLIRKFYQRVMHEDDYRVPAPLLRMVCSSENERQTVAASAQDEFSKFVEPKVADYLLQLKRKSIDVEGIALVGGGALNVVTNQLIREKLTSFPAASDSRPRDVYIPPSPGDSGLAIGAIWSLFPPLVCCQPLQYLGFRLFDGGDLADEARKRGAQKLSDLGGVEYLAELLVGGPNWQRNPLRKTPNPVIAVVRGRQEFGPRALGHRSLLAFPEEEMRDRMNRIKFRQWYRPAAPMIAEEALEYVFGQKFLSTFMEFAPIVREEVRQRFPGLSHLDGTARHQSVRKADEPWVHALLLAVGRRTGLAAQINTSFNSRGKPMTNTVKESLDMLDTLEGLDFIVIEDGKGVSSRWSIESCHLEANPRQDWLFQGPAVQLPQ